MSDKKSEKLSVAGWRFSKVPEEWEFLENHGLFYRDGSGPGCSVVATSDELPAGTTLAEYITQQLELVRGYVPEAEAATPDVLTVRDSEEALQVTLRHTSNEGLRIVQRQIFARDSQLVGILTLTAEESRIPMFEEAMNQVVAGSSFGEGGHEDLDSTGGCRPRSQKRIR